MKQFFPAILLVASCATKPAEPLRYTALPPAPSASSQADAFDPSPALTSMSSACRSAELPQPNALDDDCDGSIDSFAKDLPLLIALAFPRVLAQDIALAVRSESNVEVPLVVSDCGEERSVCTVYIDAKNLARGRHALLARHTDQGAQKGTHALVVSTQTPGKVTTYLATLAADVTEQALGALALP
ncbi:MAG TPA: hypothetical protein VFX59_23950 [Polyangiales bacterium]|nr:hypothetical protein [Polyangiales bacterium]